MSEHLDVMGITGEDWQDRLEHIVETMRQTSLHTDPSDMVRVYSSRMEGFMRIDRMLSLSRRDVKPPGFLVARDSERKVELNPWNQRHLLPRLEGGLLGSIMHSNKAYHNNDLSVDAADPAYELLKDYRSMIAVPVFDGGEALNVVVFLRKPAGAFDPHQLPQSVWTSNLFGRATNSLVLSKRLADAYKKLDEEMKTIADLQRSLLPSKLPVIPGLDLGAYYQPATRAGGDYYDFFPLPEGRWGMLIADVSGHGAPAAVLMAVTHTLAHTPPNPPLQPGDLLSHVNLHLADRYTGERGNFVTAFFGIYDPATRRITYSSAGHHPPRIKRCSDGSLFRLDGAQGLPMGIVGDEKYEQAEAQLQRGDQMILYTDGITESFSSQGEMFGAERLDSALAHCRLDASDLIKVVLDDLQQFTEGKEAEDDRTIVVAKVK